MAEALAVLLAALGLGGAACALLTGLGLGRRVTIESLVAPRHRQEEDGARRGLLPGKAAEVAVSVLGSFLAGLVVFGGKAWVSAALVALGGGIALPRLWRALSGDRSRQRLRRQVPEALATVSSALRAGRNLTLALEEAAARTPEPLASHLRGAVSRLDAGERPEAVFSEMHRRLGLAETAMLEAAAKALAVTGGNMAEALDTIAALSRDREAARAEARAGAAEQTLVALMLSVAPAFVYWLIRSSDPAYFDYYTLTPGGNFLRALLVAGLPALGGVISYRVLSGGGEAL